MLILDYSGNFASITPILLLNIFEFELVKFWISERFQLLWANGLALAS